VGPGFGVLRAAPEVEAEGHLVAGGGGVFRELLRPGVGGVRSGRTRMAGREGRRLGGPAAGMVFDEFEREPVETGAVAGEMELVGGLAEEGVAEEIGEFGVHEREMVRRGERARAKGKGKGRGGERLAGEKGGSLDSGTG